MYAIIDPRTGDQAPVADRNAFLEDLNAARSGGCEHPVAELRRWGQSDGSFAIKDQCLSCGEPLGTARRVANRHTYRPADLSLRIKAEELNRRALDAVRIRHIDRTAELMGGRAVQYDAYLASVGWRRKRVAVLNRCKHVCEGCGLAPAHDVHHLTYDHFGDELLYELVGLCRPCHDKAHAKGPLAGPAA